MSFININHRPTYIFDEQCKFLLEKNSSYEHSNREKRCFQNRMLSF